MKSENLLIHYQKKPPKTKNKKKEGKVGRQQADKKCVHETTPSGYSSDS